MGGLKTCICRLVCHYLFYKVCMCLYISLVFRLRNLLFSDWCFLILNPSSFSALDILFLYLSNLGPFGFLIMIRPSSLYSPVLVLLIIFDSWERIRAPTSFHTSTHLSPINPHTLLHMPLLSVEFIFPFLLSR